MWTSSGLRVCIVWAIKLRNVGYVYGGSGTKTWAHKLKERDACLQKTGAGGVPFVGEAGRPAWADRPRWPRASPRLDFLPTRSFLLHDFLSRVLHELHCPKALVHSFSCIIDPSTWCLMLWVMFMLPCSTCFTCPVKFLQSEACCPPMLVLFMWSWWKLMKGYPTVHAWLT
jgi:hypothetical protein